MLLINAGHNFQRNPHLEWRVGNLCLMDILCDKSPYVKQNSRDFIRLKTRHYSLWLKWRPMKKVSIIIQETQRGQYEGKNTSLG